MRAQAPFNSVVLLVAAHVCGCERSGPINPGLSPDAEGSRPTASAASRAPAPSAPREPAGSPPPAQSHAYLGGSWATCADGFRISGDPGKDLTRLSYLCGPYHGMLRYPKRWSDAVDVGQAPVTHELALQRDDCFRVFAVAERQDTPFTVSVSVRGVEVGLATGRDGYALVGSTGAICTPTGGATTIRIHTTAQRARVVHEVWLLR